MLKRIVSTVASVAFTLGAVAANAQGQPVQWRYSFDANGVATATYLGNVDIRGTIIAPSSVINVREYVPVCDGVTVNSDGIQEAIDAAEVVSLLSGSAAVFFPACEYNIGGATITVPSNITLYGEGATSRILSDASLRDGTPTDDLFRNDDQAAGNSNIQFLNLTINGDRSNALNQYNSVDFTKCASCQIIGVTFEDAGVGLWLDETVDTLVSDSSFTRVISNKSGIATDGGLNERLQIIGSSFFGSSSEAIDLNGPTNGVTISGNIFYDNHTADDDSGVNGNTEVIDIGDGVTRNIDNVSIVGNVFDLNGAARAALWIKQQTSSVTVGGNIFRDAKTGTTSTYSNAMIIVSTSSKVSIVNNVIDTADRGIALTDDNGTQEFEGVIISGNIISNLLIDGITANATSVRTVNIVGNSIDGNSASGIGINLAAVKGLRIEANEIWDFDGDGIQLTSTVLNPNIVSNLVRNNGGVGIDCATANLVATSNQIVSNTGHGIDISGEDAVLRDNLIETNDHGVNIRANRVQVGGSHIRGNAVGVDIPAAQIDLIIQSNYIKGNTSAQIDNAGNAGGSSIVADNIIA